MHVHTLLSCNLQHSWRKCCANPHGAVCGTRMLVNPSRPGSNRHLSTGSKRVCSKMCGQRVHVPSQEPDLCSAFREILPINVLRRTAVAELHAHGRGCLLSRAHCCKIAFIFQDHVRLTARGSASSRRPAPRARATKQWLRACEFRDASGLSPRRTAVVHAAAATSRQQFFLLPSLST